MKQLLLLMAICIIGDKLVCQKSLKSNLDSTLYKKVDSLIQLSRVHTDKREFDKAFELIKIAEKLQKENKDTLNSIYGRVCLNFGRVLFYKGYDMNDVEHWYLKAISIQQKTLGNKHPEYSNSLISLANLYYKFGLYEKSKTLYLEANKIQEKALGKENSTYALSLNNLALVYSEMGFYGKAEPLFLESRIIREKVLGKDHPNYASSLTNLAILHTKKGDYSMAEPLFLEALKIYEKAYGKEHPLYANNLLNLAYLYRTMANYERAESLYLESRLIKEKVVGNEDPAYAEIINSLADFYNLIGVYDKAESLYLESIAIREKKLGKENTKFSESLNNLALLYFKMGLYEKAEPLYWQSKAICEKTFGIEHPSYAASLSNLGILYLEMSNFEKAESLFIESKTIIEKTLGKQHPEYASILESLSSLYYKMGNYKMAEPLLLESKVIIEKALGKQHPEYASSLKNLSLVYFKLGNNEKAELLYVDAIDMKKEHIASALHHLSEKEMQQYLLTFEDDIANIASAAHQMPKSSGMPKLCFDNALFFKGFLLNAYNYCNRVESSDSVFAEKFQLLKSFSRRLAVEYSKPIAERRGVIELEEKSNTLEKKLTKINTSYKESMKQVSWQDIQKELKSNEAAIEFINYPFSNKNSIDSLKSHEQKMVIYAALLITPAMSQPLFIPLFEEKSIDSLFNKYSDRKSDYVNNLYTLTSRGVKPSEAKNRSLFELIWQPLEKELIGANTIYYSKTGLLHRINLDAIPISETETLADKYQLINLNSTRQMVINNLNKKINQQAILYGGIRYDFDSLKNKETLMLSQVKGDISFQMVDSKLRGGNWDYLAGTEREVDSIEKIVQQAGMDVTLKKGYEATEESIKSIGSEISGSPRILHIATHGYFFPDTKKTEQSLDANRKEESIFKLSDHPMLRSGLIMASGNAAWQGQQQLEGREDGILTAYEISLMNLKNTELVVLSACETGLGDIQGNEGVYGLQRAFKLAGAKYLIMSLWQVPDRQTSILMTLFYKKWLEEKKSIPEAFHTAQKELRDKGLDPYQWAGFVLME